MNILFEILNHELYPFYEKEWEVYFTGIPFNEKPYFSDFILSLGFLKIADIASHIGCDKFSNETLLYNLIEDYELKEYESEYSSGDNCRNILEKTKNHIAGFIPKIMEVFKFFNFNKVITFLDDSNSLPEIIFHLSNLDFNIFSIDDLKEFYYDFINSYLESAICYHDYHDEYGSPISSNDKKFNRFLIDLLLHEVNLKERDKITIYDPSCSDGSLLFDCKNRINRINPNCKVTIVGCESNPRLFGIALSKLLFENENPHNFLMFDVDSDSEFKQNFLEIFNFDFVVSNFDNVELLKPQKFNTYNDIYNVFNKNLQYFSDKVVIATSLRNMDYLFPILGAYCSLDILDTVFTLPLSSLHKNNSIFILNNNKLDNRKNKFLLIDEFDPNSKKISNRKYKLLKKYYKSFEEYENSKILLNSEIYDVKSQKFIKEFNFHDLIYDKKIGNVNDRVYLLEELSHVCINVNDDADLLIKNKDITYSDKLAFYPHEINPEEYGDYFSCKLKKNKILKEYLYYYINSNKGRNDIAHLTEFNNDLFNNLKFLRIPFVNKKEQNKVIDVSKKLSGFFNEMEMWKNNFLDNILDYHPALDSYKKFSCNVPFSDDKEFITTCKNWRIVYQGLAWPLAYNYLKATKGSTEISLKKDNYLKFFEFLTSFNVIILISGIKNSDISEEELDEIECKLWKCYKNNNNKWIKYPNERTWHRMHFGGWTNLYGKLNEIYKEYNFSIPVNYEFFKNLSKKEYVNLFNNLRERRNNDFHGGIMDDIDSNTKFKKLDEYMDKNIFNILHLYCGLKFYYTTRKNEDLDSNEIRTVIPLNGPCEPDLKNEMEIKGKLKPQRLYLYDPLNNKFLKIDDDLMKFKFDKKTNKYQLFIFNGIDKKKEAIEYKCYREDDLKDFIPIDIDEIEDETYNVSDKFKKNVLGLNSYY